MMTRIKQTIDFDLIHKKINGTISEDEEVIFQNWLESNEANKTYYEKARTYYSDGSHFDHNTIDTQSAWLKVKRKVNSGKSFPRNKVGGWMVAVVLAMLVVSYFVIQSPSVETKKEVATQIEIEHGKSNAILTLHDGTQQNLTEQSQLTEEIDGTQIVSDGKSITYTGQSENPVTTKNNSLETPQGGEYFLVLSDGTKVWLNAQTKLNYPVQFYGSNRTVELIGEAYFEVAHDDDKPFFVTSGDQTIKVLGTSFNVSSYPDDEQIATTLLSGSVRVSAHNSETSLVSNQQSIMDKQSGKLTTRNVEAEQFVLWKSGEFYFENQSIVDVMKILARWYDIEVFYDNSEISKVRLSGGFPRYENFEKVKTLIEKTGTVKIILNKNTVLLKKVNSQ